MEIYSEKVDEALEIIINLGLMTKEETLNYEWSLMDMVDLLDLRKNKCINSEKHLDIFFPFTISTSIEYSGNRNLIVTNFLCGVYNKETNTPEIQIGDITFKIMSKRQTWGLKHYDRYSPMRSLMRVSFISEYLFVDIESEDKTDKYNFTLWETSGLWRLLDVYKENGNVLIYKGTEDYVQQSMIHCDLQKFINDNIFNVRYKYKTHKFTDRNCIFFTDYDELKYIYQ